MAPHQRYNDRPFPHDRFTPGRGMPHPVKDPRGSMHGGAADAQPVLPPAHWAEQRAYRHGVDLFNAEYFWEAHEAWEALWRDAADPAQKLFLHALIQLAAALLKRRMGNGRGTAILAGKALLKLRRVSLLENLRGGDLYMGADVSGIVQRLERGLWPLPETGVGGGAAPLFLDLPLP